MITPQRGEGSTIRVIDRFDSERGNDIIEMVIFPDTQESFVKVPNDEVLESEAETEVDVGQDVGNVVAAECKLPESFDFTS